MIAKKPNFTVVQDNNHLKDVVRKLKGEEVLGVDIEGTSLDPYEAKLVLVQLSSAKNTYVIYVEGVDLTLLKDLLEDPGVRVVAHNAKFDYGMLKVHAGVSLTNVFDTMLAERVLTTGISRENSLSAVAQKYLGLELEKSTRETFFTTVRKTFTKKQLEYAALDAYVLIPIMRLQEKELKKAGLAKIADLEFKLIQPVSEMELRGFYIDVDKWRSHIRNLEKKRDEVAEKIQDYLRPYYKVHQTDLFGNHSNVVNLNSPSQILDAFRKVGLDLPSTGEAVLRIHDNPLCKMLLEYRGFEKLISAFGENLLAKINKRTGRIHPDYMQIGADTGRFACSNPNLQQIPKESEFRSCFTATKGYKLVVADYSQIELRILAEVSEDPVFVEAFKKGVDLHTLTASQMFGVPLEAVDKNMRFQAKSINFGLMYGRGAKSLAVQLGVSEDQAKELLNKYFKTYSKVKKWLDKVSKDAVREKFSETLGGRRRYYTGLDPEDAAYERQVAYVERQGKNTPIQGTSADMTKYALVFLYERIKAEGLDAVPIHTVHDEIVVEVKESQAEKMVEVLTQEMKRAGKLLLKKVPVKVEAVVSDVWEH